MKIDLENHIPYKKPEIEFVEFELEHRIATSEYFGSGSICTE